MKETKYLSIDEVLAIHFEMLRRFGGKEGISSLTLLHSAVERYKVTFEGNDLYPAIFAKAAALLHSLIQNHPFEDANKRTAIVSCARFLYINGYTLNLPLKESTKFTLDIALSKLKFEAIIDWLKKHSAKNKDN